MNRFEFCVVILATVREMAFNMSIDHKQDVFIFAVEFYFFLLICFKVSKRTLDLMPSTTRTTSGFILTTHFTKLFMELGSFVLNVLCFRGYLSSSVIAKLKTT